MVVRVIVVFFECYCDRRDRHVLTHSFPTRRSSDLGCAAPAWRVALHDLSVATSGHYRRGFDPASGQPIVRSEEHTSELQSLMRISYAVFCLKNNKKT